MHFAFTKVTQNHKHAIFFWLKEPHVREFWDNTQGHKDDVINFINGRKEPSSYCDGLYTYWVGMVDGQPYSIDYMIGNRNYFGKGLGAKTLAAFIDFFKETVDPLADTFFIDPDITNPRAKHVYKKAGFKYIGDFIMEGSGCFAGRKSHFLVKCL